MTGLDRTDPYDTFQRATDRQDLSSADDRAAVLAWRIQPERRHDGSTVPALPAVPMSLEADDYWHRYFDRRHELIDRHAALRSQVAKWTPSIAPTWADPLFERDRDLDRRVETLLGSADAATGRRQDWVTAVDPRITTNPAWPQTAASLDTAARAVVRADPSWTTSPERTRCPMRTRRGTALAHRCRHEHHHRRHLPLPPPTFDYARALGNGPRTQPGRGR